MSGIKATWDDFNIQFAQIGALEVTQARMLLKTLEKIIICEAGIDKDHWCPRCTGIFDSVLRLLLKYQVDRTLKLIEELHRKTVSWKRNSARPGLGCGGCGSLDAPLIWSEKNGKQSANCSHCGWGVLDVPMDTALKVYWRRVSIEGKRVDEIPKGPYSKLDMKNHIDPESHLPEPPPIW